MNSKRKVQMNEDEKITAFKELVELIKENSKYLPEGFNPDAELEKGRKEKYPEIIFETNNIEGT